MLLVLSMLRSYRPCRHFFQALSNLSCGNEANIAELAQLGACEVVVQALRRYPLANADYSSEWLCDNSPYVFRKP
jgi:hypothetical protein